MLKIDDFDYNLPEELIATVPAAKRDCSRLLVLGRDDGKVSHHNFYEIGNFLKKGDVLVLNNSKVFPARLIGKKETGGKAEILLGRQVGKNSFEAIGHGLKTGIKITFENSSLIAKISKKTGETYQIDFNLSGELFFKEVDKIGNIPLPPYILSHRNGKEHVDDKIRYQTVYAKYRGSAAAPTAGLHFTEDMLKELKKKGVEILELTLHVGLGTFAPVKNENIESGRLHTESFSIKEEVFSKLVRAKKKRQRIFAVGTTSCRVLEHIFSNLKKYENFTQEISDVTNIFIYPDYEFKCIDGLITNFHVPKSSLLMLVSAFAGRKNILKAYEEAIKERYRFYSYGDAMLII